MLPKLQYILRSTKSPQEGDLTLSQSTPMYWPSTVHIAALLNVVWDQTMLCGSCVTPALTELLLATQQPPEPPIEPN